MAMYFAVTAYTLFNLAQNPKCDLSEGWQKCIPPVWDTSPDALRMFDLYVYTRFPGDQESSLLWSRKVTIEASASLPHPSVLCRVF